MANHPQNQPSKSAFVLGNGKSRLHIQVEDLKSHGYLYGCNALYRETSVDHLVAVDVKMANEIIESGYHKNHTVWTNPNKGIIDTPYINFFDTHKGWSSGPTALWLAAKFGHKEIFILGFDFEGVDGKFNNVYADTFNYKKSSEVPTFFGNWVSQTEKVFREYKDTMFYRVVGKKFMTPPCFTMGINNYRNINYNDFAARFNITFQKS